MKPSKLVYRKSYSSSMLSVNTPSSQRSLVKTPLIRFRRGSRLPSRRSRDRSSDLHLASKTRKRWTMTMTKTVKITSYWLRSRVSFTSSRSLSVSFSTSWECCPRRRTWLTRSWWSIQTWGQCWPEVCYSRRTQTSGRPSVRRSESLWSSRPRHLIMRHNKVRPCRRCS